MEKLIVLKDENSQNMRKGGMMHSNKLVSEWEKTTTQKRLYEILKPLQQENSSSLEYMHQIKSGLDVDRRFRSIETLYATILSQIISLEDRLSSEKEKTLL